MALPGLTFRDPSKIAFAFDAPTYTKLVTDTLGNHGLPGDDLEVAQAELSDLMDAFTADVTSDKDFAKLPTGRVFGGTIAALTTIGAELDASDAAHAALGASFDFLAATFGVWGIFDTLVRDIQTALYNLYSDVLNVIYSLNPYSNFPNPGQFGGGL
jgi:hypothetical protein